MKGAYLREQSRSWNIKDSPAKILKMVHYKLKQSFQGLKSIIKDLMNEEMIVSTASPNLACS